MLPLPARVKVVVRHRLTGGGWHRTQLSFPIPEGIDLANVDDFLAAMVEHTAAVHQEEHFGQPERELVNALRRQVLTGIAADAADGPGRRLAARLLAVLRLGDRQLLEQYRTPRRGSQASG